MKAKRLISLVCLILCVAIVFTACSGSDDDVEAGVVTRAVEADDETTTAPATVEAQDISFYEVKDGDNTIKISPIYAKDGKTVVAAYILFVKDKNNKEVKVADFPLLLSVVEATSTETSITLTKDKNKNYIKVNSYADEQGNLLILQDYGDINNNKNKSEYLQLKKVTNKEGSTHYILTDNVIELKKSGKNLYVVIDGKKITVDIVDSDNKAVKKKIETQTASTTDKTKNTTTTDSTKAETTTSGGTNNSENTKTKEYYEIILLKNGKAKSAAKGVNISANEVSITSGGDYLVTSNTSEWHGIIKIELDPESEAELRFENVNISYNKGSIIQIIDSTDSTDRSFLETEASAESLTDDELNDAMEDLADRESAPNVSLSFPTGTSSTFKSSANSYSGVVYNESKLTVKGNGKVTFEATANANNVICSSKSVTFKNVNATLQSAAYGVTDSIGGSKGIFSYGKVNIESGKVTIKSNGDAVRCDRFRQDGGTLSATSSAADGIDAEDSININSGTCTVVALEKSSFKVRRVNNQERWDNDERVSKSDCIRSGKD
ncbi:MAG: carbohydrate-binding domain-containing protein, partial [Ruminococcaceae bacterium]|nr:carbohydrate-binding domain-containing protein [Oscillospiraceae bacterium]